jgi:hypothetical protein
MACIIPGRDRQSVLVYISDTDGTHVLAEAAKTPRIHIKKTEDDHEVYKVVSHHRHCLMPVSAPNPIHA